MVNRLASNLVILNQAHRVAWLIEENITTFILHYYIHNITNITAFMTAILLHQRILQQFSIYLQESNTYYSKQLKNVINVYVSEVVQHVMNIYIHI